MSRPEFKNLAIDEPVPPVARPRRASLPSVILKSSALAAQQETETEQERNLLGVETTDDANIGFAVTSGSNPRRRSRSADAFYDASKGHRMSPIQWRQWRRRSDEIKYWRDSVAESPALTSKLHDDEIALKEEAGETGVTTDATVDEEGDAIRDTFDFGVLASSMQERENISMEERVVTLEVKLMSLEYAISKLQAQPPSPAGSTSQYLQPTLGMRNTSVDSEPPATSSPSKFLGQSYVSSIESQSTQPTSHSSNEFHQQRKLRPISNAPTIRPQRAASPATSDKERKARNRTSITSLTIDHYTTLIGLIRREQAARIRLEDQVSELQQQLISFQYPPPPHSRSQVLRWKGNPYVQNSSEALDLQSGRSAFDHDDTDTDDGDQEVYETPTERREFEGAVFESPFAGEAF